MDEGTFSASPLAQLRAIEFVRRLLAEGRPDPRRYKNVWMHHIDGGELVAPFGAGSKARADLTFVRRFCAGPHRRVKLDGSAPRGYRGATQHPHRRQCVAGTKRTLRFTD